MTPQEIQTALNTMSSSFPKPGEMAIALVRPASDTGAFEGTTERAYVISKKSAWQLEDKPPTRTFAPDDPAVLEFAREVAEKSAQSPLRLFVVIDLASKTTSAWVTTKSGCFVATAVFGSPLARQVVVLSALRDDVLLSSGIGRVAVRTYYRASPRLASFIARSRRARAVTRLLLVPIVGVARLVLCQMGQFDRVVTRSPRDDAPRDTRA